MQRRFGSITVVRLWCCLLVRQRTARRTTTCYHRISIEAARNGKHVYVEKPISHNIWEGRKQVEAAEKYGKFVATHTNQKICGTHFGLEDFGDRFQHFIANLVAKVVVDLFEVVNVTDHQ